MHFDNFKAQCTDRVLQLLEDNNIDTVFVPANCTGELQPMDLSMNKTFYRQNGMPQMCSEAIKVLVHKLNQ